MFATVLIFKSSSHTPQMKKKNKKLKQKLFAQRLLHRSWGYIEELHFLLKSFFFVSLVTSYQHLIVSTGLRNLRK